MILNLLNDNSEAQKSEKPNSTRRKFLKGIGTTATIGMAGCTRQRQREGPPLEGGSEPDPEIPEERKQQEDEETEKEEEKFLNGVELHDNWAYGETDAVRDITAKDFVDTTDSIIVEDLTKDLERADNRIDGVASALETASNQYHGGNYEGRHQHIVSALDLAMDELDDELWDFDLLSNMNYTESVNGPMQYSEIIVPTEGNDHTDTEIINAALKGDYNHAIHTPGEEVEKPLSNVYKQSMKILRNSDGGLFPPSDVEAIQNRINRLGDEDTDAERVFASWASGMGYQLFDGGHEVETEYDWQSAFEPNRMFVPANKEVHGLIHDEKYNKGDMSLNLAINEKYFNEGYDEVEGPVTVDITSTDNDWDITLEERPDWSREQGYPEENNTENQQEPEQEYLSGIQLHDNWIHGEDGDVGNSFGVSEHGISLDDVTKELESADNRIDGIVSAIKVASSQHRADDYEGRHRHIVSAVDQGIDRLDDELWDFDLLSNMNYTQTVGETIQYSEIILPKEENDHSDIEIINAALKRDYNNAIHKPGEINTEDQFYKHTMAGVRDSENGVDLPPHDVEAIQGRVDRGAEESFFASGAELMGYQLFAGGHEVNNGFEYNPDQMLVPANKEVHELIDDVKYENGDMSLNLAVNEKYFNEGYDEFEGPVSVDIKNTENDWDITLEKRPEWNHEQGYPEETA